MNNMRGMSLPETAERNLFEKTELVNRGGHWDLRDEMVAHPWPGQLEIVAPLGEGGCGQVFVAVCLATGQLYALKRMHEGMAENPMFRTRFVREAQIVAQLEHPGIAGLIDAAEDEAGIPWIATELVAGVNLEQLVEVLARQNLVLPAPVAVAIVLQVLDALTYAHRAQGPKGPLRLVHRDISLRNVMVSFSGMVKLIDFGVAHADIDDFRTRPGRLLGAFRTMSPEQARGEPVDDRSDLYSVGILLYELLTGRPMRPMQKGLLENLAAIEATPPSRPSDVMEDIEPALDWVVLRALQPLADDRFESAAEFAHALRQAVLDVPSPAVLKQVMETFFVSKKQVWANIQARAQVRFSVELMGFDEEVTDDEKTQTEVAFEWFRDEHEAPGATPTVLAAIPPTSRLCSTARFWRGLRIGILFSGLMMTLSYWMLQCPAPGALPQTPMLVSLLKNFG